MIKRLVGYVCAGLLTVAHAQVPAAHVYDLHATSQHRPAASSSDLVSPETARLILAQRLGLSQYHSLKSVDEQTIRQLNDFGGSPQRLLSNGYGDLGLGKLLVIIEAVQNPTRKHSAPAKKVSNAKGFRQLMRTLFRYHQIARWHISGVPNLKPASFICQFSTTRKSTFTRRPSTRD